jgi:hypothetical protein
MRCVKKTDPLYTTRRTQRYTTFGLLREHSSRKRHLDSSCLARCQRYSFYHRVRKASPILEFRRVTTCDYERKVHGSLRLCIDYRGLNEVTRKDACLLPRLDDTLDGIKDANF